jgi:hypothetical protein
VIVDSFDSSIMRSVNNHNINVFLYHEKQVKNEDGVHALNNIFQCKVVSRNSMLALAKKMNDDQSSTSNCDAESKSEHDKVL